MKFDYVEYFVQPSPASPHNTSLFRPVIRVRMTGAKRSRSIWALLDTGADESYITASVAEKLGVLPISTELSGVDSASGRMSVWYGTLELEVSDGAELHRFPLVVGVVSQDWSEMILGHLGFLDRFDAHFSRADKLVTLSNRVSDFTLAG